MLELLCETKVSLDTFRNNKENIHEIKQLFYNNNNIFRL